MLQFEHDICIKEQKEAANMCKRTNDAEPSRVHSFFLGRMDWERGKAGVTI